MGFDRAIQNSLARKYKQFHTWEEFAGRVGCCVASASSSSASVVSGGQSVLQHLFIWDVDRLQCP